MQHVHRARKAAFKVANEAGAVQSDIHKNFHFMFLPCRQYLHCVFVLILIVCILLIINDFIVRHALCIFIDCVGAVFSTKI